MFVCPVCEHQQAQRGDCDVCGKPLAVPRVLDLPIQRLADLEVTRYAVGVVSAAELPELERTQFRGGGQDLPVHEMPELERGRALVGEVPVEPLGDLDIGRFEDRSELTPAPVGVVSCRYCRHVQAVGLLCDRCGMRLPRHTAARRDDAPRVLHACGAMAQVGRACSTCGVQVALPSE